MPQHVLNPGALPVAGDDLQTVLALAAAGAPQTSAVDFTHAVLEGGGQAQAATSLLVLLRGGQLQLEAGGKQLDLGPGQIATVPAGPLVWRAAAADCVLILLRADNPTLALEALDLSHPLSPGGAPNVALVDTPMPETRRHTFFEAGNLSWGLWSATPYLRRVTPYGFTEIMWITKGSMVLTDAAGKAAHFAAGEICAACAGAEVSWQNTEYIEKFWLIRVE